MILKRSLSLMALVCLGVSLSGCWLVYRPDIKQGNVLTPEKIQHIHPGMDKAQVTALLGSPVLTNVFEKNQMIYVYTVQPGHAPFKAQHLRIYFENGLVTRYTSDVH